MVSGDGAKWMDLCSILGAKLPGSGDRWKGCHEP